MTPRAQYIIDHILREDVTPELIVFASETMQEENSSYFFIQVIAGGFPNPDVAVGLTNIALEDISGHVLASGKQ